MGNPLMQFMSNNMGASSNPLGNMTQILQQFNRFRFGTPFFNPPRNPPTQSSRLPQQQPERTQTARWSFRAVWLHG